MPNRLRHSSNSPPCKRTLQTPHSPPYSPQRGTRTCSVHSPCAPGNPTQRRAAAALALVLSYLGQSRAEKLFSDSVHVMLLVGATMCFLGRIDRYEAVVLFIVNVLAVSFAGCSPVSCVGSFVCGVFSCWTMVTRPYA